jgi:hypothetical protein
MRIRRFVMTVVAAVVLSVTVVACDLEMRVEMPLDAGEWGSNDDRFLRGYTYPPVRRISGNGLGNFSFR